MDLQPSYYSIIPASVRYDKDLKPNEKLLYGEITALAQAQGFCWASNSYFAELYDVSKETVSRWISKLDKKGYIRTKVIYVENSKQIDKRFIYISDTPIDKKINTPRQNNQEGIDEKVKSPIDKKVKDNNTSINNTSITITTTGEENEKSPESVSELKKVLNFYENNFGLIKEFVLNDLTDYTDILNADMVIYSMQKAIENNATFGYAKSIMQRWVQSKVTSMDEVKAAEVAFKNKKKTYGKRGSTHKEIIPSWMKEKQEQSEIEKQPTEQEEPRNIMSEEEMRAKLKELIGE